MTSWKTLHWKTGSKIGRGHTTRIAAFLAIVLASAASAESWNAAGNLIRDQQYHTATLLANGEVLVVGDGSESYDPSNGTWSPREDLAFPRQNHTATLLLSGQVLVVGGCHHSLNDALRLRCVEAASSAELYDPTTGKWSPTDPLSPPRHGHTATLLPSGKVLVVGGSDDSGLGVLANVAIYDPATHLWDYNTADPLATARFDHTATLLPSGKVLVAGGRIAEQVYEFYAAPTATAEIYDPQTGEWSETGEFNEGARYGHTATLLPSGKVLTSGGMNVQLLDGNIELQQLLSSAEIYDPTTGIWSSTCPLLTARQAHTATLLPSGEVMLVGGLGERLYAIGLGLFAIDAAEVFDPTDTSCHATGSWQPLATPGGHFAHTSTLLGGGQVLLAGGADILQGQGTSEIVARESSLFVADLPAPEPIANLSTRYGAIALLPSGRVLAASDHDWLESSDSAEILDPASRSWTATAPMLRPRRSSTATLLSDGRVLVAAGDFDLDTFTPFDTAELYTPMHHPKYSGSSWTPAGELSEERHRHSATRLADGRVLVVGGDPMDLHLVQPNATTSAEIFDPSIPYDSTNPGAAWQPTAPAHRTQDGSRGCSPS